jgi:hypothetical protein
MTMTKQYEWKVEQFIIHNFNIENYQSYIDKNFSQEGYKLHTAIPHTHSGECITFVFEREKKSEVAWDDYDDVDHGVDMMREQETLSRDEDD